MSHVLFLLRRYFSMFLAFVVALIPFSGAIRNEPAVPTAICVKNIFISEQMFP